MKDTMNKIWKNINTGAPLDRKVLIWREDAKTMIHDFIKSDYINHPEYAYSLWTEAPELPNINNIEEENVYDDIPCDTEPTFDE